MPTLFLPVLIAIIGGVAAAVQAPLVGLLNRGLGTLESIFVIYAGGAVGVLTLFLATGGGNLLGANWRALPWYALLAGPLGLAVIGAISYGAPRIGVAATLTLLVAAQLIMGVVLDHFGLVGAVLRPVDLPRAAGVAILLLGTWLIIR